MIIQRCGAAQHKNLGFIINSDGNYLVEMQKTVRQKALRSKYVLHAKALWSYNRFEVLRAIWKAVAVPGLTFGNAVLCFDGPPMSSWNVSKERRVGWPWDVISRSPMSLYRVTWGGRAFAVERLRARQGIMAACDTWTILGGLNVYLLPNSCWVYARSLTEDCVF